MPGIKYIQHSNIDKSKWDTCIDKATNGLIYSYSFYLDIATGGKWDALVFNDYEAVMPLTWRKKYGIYYLYQPPFTAQTGVTGLRLTANEIQDFINAIPKKFRYRDICFNYFNEPALDTSLWNKRNNYIVSNNYSLNQNTNRNIQKAIKAGITIHKKYELNEVSPFLLTCLKDITKDTHTHVQVLTSLFTKFAQQKNAVVYTAVYNNSLIAYCILFYAQARAYYIMACTTTYEAKKLGAAHLLVHNVLIDCMEKNITLDFEGSDIPGIAQFYKGFGAIAEPYYSFKQNNLPYLIKWLKK